MFSLKGWMTTDGTNTAFGKTRMEALTKANTRGIQAVSTRKVKIPYRNSYDLACRLLQAEIPCEVLVEYDAEGVRISAPEQLEVEALEDFTLNDADFAAVA